MSLTGRVNWLFQQIIEEEDDTMPDPTVDGSVPYFIPNHSGQSRVRENFENDELERVCKHTGRCINTLIVIVKNVVNV